MTTFNYGPLASKAVQLIAKYGTGVELIFNGDLATPADPTKPWRGPDQATAQDYSPRGLVVTFDKKDIDGDLIRTTDQQLLVAGQDPEVLRLINDGRSMDDVRFAITSAGRIGCLNLTPLAPGDTVMLYTMRLRLG